MEEQMQQQQAAAENMRQTEKTDATKHSAGEYIDFEEVK